ncbi:sirohydrochlorin chelatase [Pseudonocardia xinjiangensis]|uniref:sirohydrochlorin chelatase n=2 Tax=Pseudonocardia xinjiangensis TaxID=75289 RepID=UPI0031E05925
MALQPVPTRLPSDAGGLRAGAEGAAPVLVAVAHGSRDPRSAATVAELADEVRRQHPGLDVRVSFLDLSAPRLPDVLAGVAAEGHRRAVVVPLLLGHAFHARVDVPGEVAKAARRHPQLAITTAGVLGGSPLLEAAALDRLAAVTGPLPDPGLGVVLAAIGSSHAPANAAVAEVVDGWARRFGWAGGVAAFATSTSPTVPQAIAALRAQGAERVAVAQWILAPGLLPDAIARTAHAAGEDVLLAAPLAAHPAVATLVADRYRTATATPTLCRTAG